MEINETVQVVGQNGQVCKIHVIKESNITPTLPIRVGNTTTGATFTFSDDYNSVVVEHGSEMTFDVTEGSALYAGTNIRGQYNVYIDNEPIIEGALFIPGRTRKLCEFSQLHLDCVVEIEEF